MRASKRAMARAIVRQVAAAHWVMWVGFVAGCAAGDAPPLVDAVGEPKVLLIGIDGVRPDVLARVFTPNIDALIAAGAFSDQAQTGLPTVSGPSWSSMLTGVWSEKHGVIDNTFVGKNYEAYPDFLTRIETVAPELHTFAVADWNPLVSEADGGPLISPAVDEVVTLDGYIFGWAEADSMSTNIAIDRLGRSGVDALFVYLGDPDETSHQNGSIGIEYEHAIERADRNVGRLIEAVRARPSYDAERWLVLMSTDHGRTTDGGHGGESPEERTIFFLASGSDAVVGPIAEAPEIVDIAVTALAHLGIEADPSWALDGRVVGRR